MLDKWILEQSAVVVLCAIVLFYASKAIATVYRDWMGKDSFAKGFFEQHARIADAVVDMKDRMTGVEAKIGNLEEGLFNLTHEVKHHPPTRLMTKERA
jgi:hypothetical protein